MNSRASGCFSTPPPTKRTSCSSITSLLNDDSSERGRAILDQVSRLTLAEPLSPPIASFQTPMIRKRKPSFVTPLRGRAEMVFESCETGSKRPRGAPPLLPNALELEESSEDNPFLRHRPMHSPIDGVSQLDMDFLAKLNAENEVPEPRFQPRTSLGQCFPSLSPTMDSAPGVLKMRRLKPAPRL